jgi:hypothetical protein
MSAFVSETQVREVSEGAGKQGAEVNICILE